MTRLYHQPPGSQPSVPRLSTPADIEAIRLRDVIRSAVARLDLIDGGDGADVEAIVADVKEMLGEALGSPGEGPPMPRRDRWPLRLAWPLIGFSAALMVIGFILLFRGSNAWTAVFIAANELGTVAALALWLKGKTTADEPKEGASHEPVSTRRSRAEALVDPRPRCRCRRCGRIGSLREFYHLAQSFAACPDCRERGYESVNRDEDKPGEGSG